MQVQIIEHATDAELITQAVVAAATFTVALRAALWASWRVIASMVALAGLALLGGYALAGIGDAGQSVWAYLAGTQAWWQWMADRVFHDGKTILAALMTVPIVWMFISSMANR
jgi:hypothetical protein